jgi:hypothetical protein
MLKFLRTMIRGFVIGSETSKQMLVPTGRGKVLLLVGPTITNCLGTLVSIDTCLDIYLVTIFEFVYWTSLFTLHETHLS